MNFYNVYTSKGKSDPKVLDLLYNKDLWGKSVIKTHLEHTAHHWTEPCVDLWEETRGDHFWTQIMQRKALIMGSSFSRTMNDNAAADYYQQQISGIEQAIVKHWDDNQRRILENVDHGTQNTVEKKQSGLDVGTVLAALRGDLNDGFFGPEDDRVQSTMFQIMMAMNEVYDINKNADGLGVATGRYPEDVYDGNGFTGGNPW
jgi:glucoamylase